MIYNKLINAATALLLIIVVCTACKKDKTDNGKQNQNGNFIPQKNKTFIYSIETEGNPAGNATVSILGTKDSSGITVYNQRTIVEDTSGKLVPVYNNLFNYKGKTYAEIRVPETWYTLVALIGTMPDIVIKKSEMFGYPAYYIMENALKTGSIISVDGPLLQGQRIEYTNNGEACSMQQEIAQIPGEGVVETVQVPAGTYTCNKFSYEVATKITSQTGDAEYTGNGNEKITVWMAHGIGVVKQETISRLTTLVPLPTGEIKEVVTYSDSRTILEKIN